MTSSRGCGSREAGGVYLTVGTSPFGRPFEDFLFDPPKILPLEELGISPIGVKIIKFPGRDVYDVVDWVGATHYPNASDVVEEGQAFLQRGENPISRRIASNEHLDLLTKGSKIILVHPRAYLTNFLELSQVLSRDHAERLDDDDCITHNLGHADRPAQGGNGKEMCIRDWWQTLIKGDDYGSMPTDQHTCRMYGSTTYLGYPAPQGFVPKYVPAAIGAFPLAGFEIVRSPDEEENERNIRSVSVSGLSYDVVAD